MLLLKYSLLIIQILLILSNLLGIPGSLISLLVPLIFVFMNVIIWKTFYIIVAIIILGEIVEFSFGYFSGKFFGISTKSFWASVVGAIVFGILMAPILFGLGAVIGVFLGAFLGTFLYEYLSSKNFALSLKRGFFSFFSRLTSSAIKIALGLYTSLIIFHHIQ